MKELRYRAMEHLGPALVDALLDCPVGTAEERLVAGLRLRTSLVRGRLPHADPVDGFDWPAGHGATVLDALALARAPMHVAGMGEAAEAWILRVVAAVHATSRLFGATPRVPVLFTARAPFSREVRERLLYRPEPSEPLEDPPRRRQIRDALEAALAVQFGHASWGGDARRAAPVERILRRAILPSELARFARVASDPTGFAASTRAWRDWLLARYPEERRRSGEAPTHRRPARRPLPRALARRERLRQRRVASLRSPDPPRRSLVVPLMDVRVLPLLAALWWDGARATTWCGVGASVWAPPRVPVDGSGLAEVAALTRTRSGRPSTAWSAAGCLCIRPRRRC